VENKCIDRQESEMFFPNDWHKESELSDGQDQHLIQLYFRRDIRKLKQKYVKGNSKKISKKIHKKFKIHKCLQSVGKTSPKNVFICSS
jgi:hypothetical protein